MLEFLYTIEIRPSSHNVLTANMDEKDRPSDVALLNGKIEYFENLIKFDLILILV